MPAAQSASTLLDHLNPIQRQAVEHTEGPLLIFAGAGSGKTRVLTHRIAHLLANKGVPPWSVLAVTFTNKAAGEMRERIVKLVGEGSRQIWAGTFHATCARLLRESGDKIGLPKGFAIYDDSDQLSLIRECLGQLHLDDKRFAPRAVLSLISRAKEKLIEPDRFSETYSGFFEDVCSKVYTLYSQKLEQCSALDFDDLLMQAVRLLQQREDVLDKYQRRFRYIMVDEYQDVNFSQYKLVQLLAASHRNLCVVGDDDQSIYMFRGADVALMHAFERDYPDATVIKLEQNYRSSRIILDAAHGVVKHNTNRKDKRLWTQNDLGTRVKLHEASNEQEEALYIRERLLEARLAGKKLADCAILYRTNAQSRALEDVFINFAMPYKIVGGQKFYDRKEVKDVIAYLRVLHNPHDAVSLKRIINVPTRGVGATTVKLLEQKCQEMDRPLWEMLGEAHLMHDLAPRSRSAVTSFASLIMSIRSGMEGRTVTELTKAILDGTGYLQDLKDQRDLESLSRAENIEELLTVTTKYDLREEEGSLSGFLEEVALISDLDSLDDKTDAVTMMTLHSSKGLEFPVVCIVGMEEGIFPHSRSLSAEKDVEEERRLCYVGITRAKEQLVLTHAYRRTLFGVISSNPPSRFLRDIPAELIEGVAPSPARNEMSAHRSLAQGRPTETRMWPTAVVPGVPKAPGHSPDFRPGTKVTHSQFGTGVVLSTQTVGDDLQVAVAFPVVGVKKLLQSFAKLQKV